MHTDDSLTIPMSRRNALALTVSGAALATSGDILARALRQAARYQIRLERFDPPTFSISAHVPISGTHLRMADTYPAELPELLKSGWTALVEDLDVRTASGARIPFSADGPNGWKLSTSVEGWLRLRYRVSLTLFQKAGWSSPLESAFIDGSTLIVCSRALFIQTESPGQTTVELVPPKGRHWVAPWQPLGGDRYRVADPKDLGDNFLAVTNSRTDELSAGAFAVHAVTMGHWRPVRQLVRDTLQTIFTMLSTMMGKDGREFYSVILMPTIDTGGQAYRQSFVYAYASPTPASRTVWANTLAHEIFHYWNYARMTGRDYASTQWFQEGFTEYVANLTLLVGRITSPAQFQAKLAEHVDNYRKLSTTLENIGTHKGKPLYSAGALVAFGFDVLIRHATGNRASLANFFRLLWIRTARGTRPYYWPMISGVLSAIVNLDWEAIHRRYIAGEERLPLTEWFALAGLTIGNGPEGKTTVSFDDRSNPAARATFASMTRKL